MKRNRFLLIGALFFAFTLGACGDESEELVVDENERIIGKWVVKSQTIFDIEFPGDGSSLTFNACGTTECTGTDYMASEETTGTFSYEFSEDKQTLIIEDDDPEAGGAYSGEWTIDQFTNDKLVITIESILGESTITFTK